MSLFSLSSEKMAMTFSSELAVNINGDSFVGLTFIVRLLTYEELLKVNAVNADNNFISLLLEDEIFELVLHEVIGISDPLDTDLIEAGIISTISGAVIAASNFYFMDVHAGIAKASQESTIFDQMQLVVAKNFNIEYKDILLMPIDELARKFALFQATFPDQALTFDIDDAKH